MKSPISLNNHPTRKTSNKIVYQLGRRNQNHTSKHKAAKKEKPPQHSPRRIQRRNAKPKIRRISVEHTLVVSSQTRSRGLKSRGEQGQSRTDHARSCVEAKPGMMIPESFEQSPDISPAPPEREPRRRRAHARLAGRGGAMVDQRVWNVDGLYSYLWDPLSGPAYRQVTRGCTLVKIINNYVIITRIRLDTIFTLKMALYQWMPT